jgi:type IV pilus assembly protein PilA
MSSHSLAGNVAAATSSTEPGPPRALGPAGFTLLELLIVCAIIAILAALGVPFLLSAKASANESSAIGSMRAINSAETNYSVTCGGGGYNVNLPQLVADAYLSPDMGFNPKSGYNFALQAADGALPGAADCAGAATLTGYYASGRPVSIPASGRRAFATGLGGTIWQDTTGVPPPEPFVAGGTVSTIQ